MITRLPVRALSTPISRSICRSSQWCVPVFDARIDFARQASPQQIRGYSVPPPVAETPKPIDLRSQLSSDSSQSSDPPKQKRTLRPYIYATAFFLVGLTAGQYIRLVLAPPPLPPAGSKEDLLMVEFLHQQAEKLPIVQSLSEDPNWTFHDAYDSLSEDERPHRLTTGPLGGARAIGGYQRIFANKESGEIISIVWFGGGIAGWPGVVHGGVTATVMDESLGRCAIGQFPAKTGVTANLELTYLKPMVTNSFYVIRTTPDPGATERKCWVSGRLETLEGRVCIEAKGLFVVPKKYTTRKIAGDF